MQKMALALHPILLQIDAPNSSSLKEIGFLLSTMDKGVDAIIIGFTKLIQPTR